MEEPTIKDRADKVEAVFSYFYDFERDDPKTPVVDILADLRHFCDRHCLDLGDLDNMAHSHYLAEIEEERHSS